MDGASPNPCEAAPKRLAHTHPLALFPLLPGDVAHQLLIRTLLSLRRNTRRQVRQGAAHGAGAARGSPESAAPARVSPTRRCVVDCGRAKWSVARSFERAQAGRRWRTWAEVGAAAGPRCGLATEATALRTGKRRAVSASRGAHSTAGKRLSAHPASVPRRLLLRRAERRKPCAVAATARRRPTRSAQLPHARQPEGPAKSEQRCRASRRSCWTARAQR